ncbi:MAG: biotin--[acetyl-CoA-carboxylase] ligase [Candidatus Omnitrophota bacterium]|jgi:BirA family biotin operon repressor/biotin-[acetyl-CoA-carboxylase] ligase
MTIDENILHLLRNGRGNYVSGEELRKHADISRAAIWKHIEKLRDEGYEIEASPHLGYRLIHIPDSLMPDEIKWKLKSRVMGREVISYKLVDSTNDVAYSLAEKGMKEGAVILAEEQAHGKGRHGRKWVSHPKGGIYMSCILRPNIPPNEIARITLLAAVAVAKSVREVSGMPAMIKWPNDILLNSRKICGILTEMKAEQDTVDFIILGIGINVNTPSNHLPEGATSLREEMARSGRVESISRVELAKKVIEHIEENYNILKKEGFDPIIDAWKHYSAMLGSRVKVVMQNKTFEAQAYDIDSDGALLVRRERGILQRVSSGDVIISK